VKSGTSLKVDTGARASAKRTVRENRGANASGLPVTRGLITVE
jgi:hypothetical protein